MNEGWQKRISKFKEFKELEARMNSLINKDIVGGTLSELTQRWKDIVDSWREASEHGESPNIEQCVSGLRESVLGKNTDVIIEELLSFITAQRLAFCELLADNNRSLLEMMMYLAETYKVPDK